MKDHVEMEHLTKFDAFMLNRDQSMDLKTWFKIYKNVSNFLTASSKTIYTLKNILQFCDNCQIRSFTDYLEIIEGKITMFAHFLNITDIVKEHESLYDFGGHCQEFRDTCMDFEPSLKGPYLDLCST